MRKTVLFAGVAAVALLPAVASAESAGRWDGFYVGLFADWADGNGDVDYTKYSADNPLPEGKCNNTKDCFSGDLGLDGFFAGGTIGYNLQTMNNLVVGIEADIAGSSVSGSTSSWIGDGNTRHMQNTNIDFDLAGTIRGRVGFTPASLPQTLFFATGGVAWAIGTTSYTLDKYKGCNTDCSFSKTSKSASMDSGLVGYAAGVGVEHALNSLWSVKAEYLYTGYLANTATGKDFELDSEIGLHNFRVGLNRRFGAAFDATPEYSGPVGTGGRWNGLYLGAFAGWADGTNDVAFTKYSAKNPLPEGKCNNTKDCFSGDLGLDGFFGGATIGYNYQTANNLVVGIEADVYGADISGSTSSWIGDGNTRHMQNTSVDMDLAGTVRGRLGFTPVSLPQTLLFVSGGVAWATGTTSYTLDKYKGCNSECYFSKTSKSAKYDGGMVGVAAGVGVEHALNNVWSVKAEYLYTGYVASTMTGKDFEFDSQIGAHNVRIGFNRSFN